MYGIGAPKAILLVLLCVCVLTATGSVAAQTEEPIPIIFDTDFRAL